MSRGGKSVSPQTSNPVLLCWKVPAFRVYSLLLKSHGFSDILTLLSNHCRFCCTSQHLVVYLPDHSWIAIASPPPSSVHRGSLLPPASKGWNKGSGTPMSKPSGAPQPRRTYSVHPKAAAPSGQAWSGLGKHRPES